MGNACESEASGEVVPGVLPRILIVGSGQSVLSYPYARAIDSFPRVCRFRGFNTASEKIKHDHAGFKFTEIGINTSKHVVDATVSRRTALLPARYLVTCHRREMPQVKRLTNFLKAETIHYKTVASADYESRRNLTSGYLAILRYLVDFPTVVIHGFCSVDGIEKNTKEHYFPRKSDGYKMHNLKYEAEKIKVLMSQGKVLLLRDLIESGEMDVEGNCPSR